MYIWEVNRKEDNMNLVKWDILCWTLLLIAIWIWPCILPVAVSILILSQMAITMYLAKRG